MLRHIIPAITLTLFLAGTALSQELLDMPAWQLSAAETGASAQLYWELPPGIDPESVTSVSVGGGTVSGFSILPERGVISAAVSEGQANPLIVEELTIKTGAGALSFMLPPTEIHWLDGLNHGGLLLRASQQITGRHNAMALLIQNMSAVDVEITGFRYAPEVIATGDLLLATDFAALHDLNGVELPWMSGTAAPELTERSSFNPETWEGLPFDHFSFSSSSLVLEPDGQAILILASPGFTAPELFSSQVLISFAPWLEYRQADGVYALQPFVQAPGF